MTENPADGGAAEEDVNGAKAEDEGLRERLAQQFAQQWGQVRGTRRPTPPVIETGPSNNEPADVPWAYDLAAQWSWRFLVITAAVLSILYAIQYLAVLVFPVVIALFIAALVIPAVEGMQRIGIPGKLGSALVVIGGIGAVALALVFVTQQIASGAGELSKQVSDGLGEIERWLQTGPLDASDTQINDWINQAQDYVTSQGQELAKHAGEFGVAVGHIVAGFFLVLFSTYFFLADGGLIWSWVVRMFPRAARAKADSSGRVAWRSLTQFVRATVLVAAVDAIGIVIVALILDVPFVGAIGVLVFLGAFVPMIGAFVSGTVAVLVALVAHGPVVALIMLGGVILVQQVEAHVLQPFLMGRFVSVHPLGVILAIAAGVLIAGIPGALVAVPLAAALNAVVLHLSSGAEDEPGGIEEPVLAEGPE